MENNKYLLITIDTEEDNWDNFKAEPTLKNIESIKYAQQIFDSYYLKPTYVITYCVANDQNSVEILKSIHTDGRCEIGTHLHPWNTPPIEEDFNVKNTMLCNLTQETQAKKLLTLHKKIEEKFKISPVSFRAGRYGINDSMLKNLIDLNYRVDSSMTPFLNWKHFHGPDFSTMTQLNPFNYKVESNSEPQKRNTILEIPLTTGFLQKDFIKANNAFLSLSKLPYRKFKLIGIMNKLNLLNKIRLTPEGYTYSEMKKLVDRLLNNNINFFNLAFHSNTLLHGCTPFTKTKEELKQFLTNLDQIINYSLSKGLKPLMLKEVENKYN
ncbi:MAG: hypothetical protein H6627_13185 [Calditrichae bacterium]|nr:hypothetical protein [Calditrichia bacterium]